MVFVYIITTSLNILVCWGLHQRAKHCQHMANAFHKMSRLLHFIKPHTHFHHLFLYKYVKQNNFFSLH